MRRIVISLLCAVFFLLAVLGFLTAGNLFLSFIGHKLYVDISCKNSSNFISCFILQFMELEKPVFKPKNSGIAIGSEKAFIEPDIRELIYNHSIVIKVALENASIIGLDEAIKKNADLSLFLDPNSVSFLNELVGIVYDTVYMKIDMRGKSARFPYFEAHSKDIKFNVSGFLSDPGGFGIRIKIYFSPKIVSRLSEELRELLTAEGFGWSSYSLNIESSVKNSSLKLESDRIRFQFDKVEVM